MIDLRYHVYSLAAVIVALAIGFIFGTSSSGSRSDMKQVERIVGRYKTAASALDTELDIRTKKMEIAQGDLKRNETLSAAILPIVLKDKLFHRNIAIIQTGDYDDTAANVKALLQASGATVSSITRISTSFNFDDSGDVLSALDAAQITPGTDESGRSAILRTIAQSITDPALSSKLITLQSKHVVGLSGNYEKWNRVIVIVGGTKSGSNHRAETIDVPLIEHLETIGAIVHCCEPSTAVTSYVPEWKRTEAGTVDNVDTACGKLSLVYLLSGEHAHYGQKQSAELLLPKTLGVQK